MELLYGCPILEDLQVKLISFDPSDPSSFEGMVKTLPKLARAHVSSFTYDDIPLEAFCNVEFLRLDKYCDVNVNNLVFPNLIHMELILGRKFKWSSVLDLLSHCPQLQTFVLENLHGRDRGWPDSLAVPECFVSRLWKCVFKNFTGLKGEMKFAKIVMRNSTSLRTMTICSGPSLFHHQKLEMITELASCPRSSVTCELLFK
ncbi:putative F-box/FBD/LRR-repeat protein At4g26350 [Lotus japonicus]|uniref:putative F-box/FBD/LRR-repeat protein At4g26350 n=1 Tax=Lotus japonicus TaxID=34305 RepID=UPI002586C855|nr:putative F-box/FBD/LRR-repeat protein At4g26350 [Lotus japonicus]